MRARKQGKGEHGDAEREGKVDVHAPELLKYPGCAYVASSARENGNPSPANDAG
jgi:hypothetical protein